MPYATAAHAPAPTPTDTLTDEQRRAVDLGLALAPGKHLKIIAVAGSGKTHTLVELARAQAKLGRSGVYLAFNKHAADEAKPRLANTTTRTMTIHALAMRAMRRAGRISDNVTSFNARQVADERFLARFGIRSAAGWSEYRLAATMLRTMTNFCASKQRRVTEDHARAAIIDHVGDPQALVSAKALARAKRALEAYTTVLAQAAQAFYDEQTEMGTHSHDTYLKAFSLDESLVRGAFADDDYIAVDEAQDCNPVQLVVLAKSGLSVVAVGDPQQAIYGWRGATDALDIIPGETCTLSRSFRFGEDIANRSNAIFDSVPYGAPVTRVHGCRSAPVGQRSGPSHAIIARTNLGLLDEAASLAVRGYAFHLDRADDLVDLVNSAQALYDGNMSKVRAAALRPFLSWNELLEEAEGNPQLKRLAKIVEDHRTRETVALAQSSVPMADAKVILITAHRSKGSEYPVVKLAGDWPSISDLRETLNNARDRGQAAQVAARQEVNTLYVAVTRAMERLEGVRRLMG